MMQPELLEPFWPYCNSTVIDSSLDHEVELHGIDTDDHMGSFDFSSSFISAEDSSDVSSSFPYISTIDANESRSFPFDVPVMLPMEQCLINVEEFIDTTNDQEELLFIEVDNLCEWIEEEQLCIEGDVWSPSPNLSMISSEASMNVTSAQSALVLPEGDMKIDTQLSILHLLKAYGEAMEEEQKELVGEIVQRLKGKACPTGATVERLAYYLMQDLNTQEDYLRQESSKNYEVAFKAFYKIFPFGRFAHFVANSAILEAMPEDAETVHIVDFDMGEGVQWPPLIEALANRCQRVKLTSIKWEEEDENCSPSPWRFDETKRQLHEYAESFGLKLKVEEMDMKALVSEMKKTKKRGGINEWIAFNCMVGLPHMAKVTSIRHVTEFLRVAKNTVNNPIKACHGNGQKAQKGIVTFGDGDGVEEKMRDCHGFGSSFDGHLVHLLALFESMECYLPHHLTEARIAMESLFLASHVSSLAHLQKWEGSGLPEMKFEAWRISNNSFLEAKELVREGENLFWVRIEGEDENQMVLGYMETPLVRVSSWR